MAEEEVRISASLQGDIAAALGRVEQQLDETGEAARRMGAEGRVAGSAMAAGMDKAAKSTGRLRDANGRFIKAGEAANETMRDTAKAAVPASVALDRLAKKARQASRSMGGLAAVMTAAKFSLFLTGGLAVVGMLSAMAAAGAIAIGGLAPMVGVLAGLGPLALGFALSMAAVKLASTQLEMPLTRIKNQFAELGPLIAGGGLRSGMDYLASSLAGLAKASGTGLRGLGAEIGEGARQTGQWVRSAGFLRQVSVIFEGLRPIVRDMIGTVLNLGKAFLNVAQGALPMTQQMADTVRWISAGLADWTAEVLANGKMADWLQKSWTIFTRTVGVLVDLVIGVYNAFRIAGGFANEFGVSIEQAAMRFRTWTESAEGQARITAYFQDALPAIREMGRLVGMLVGGFASLAASQDVAPLLAQIRTELVPALGDLITHVTGPNGVGPALISAFAAIASALAQMPTGAITALIIGIAKLAEGIGWLITNVPGLGTAISVATAAFLGLKIVMAGFGFVSGILGGVSTAIGWVKTGATLLGTAFSAIGPIIMGVIRGIGAAFMANPIGLAITVIIGLVVLLWTKFEWFRDAVMVALEFIGSIAKTVWEALVAAWDTTVNALKTAWDWVTGGVMDVWNTVVGAITDAATWLWENGIKPIWDVIYTVAMAVWSGIKFYIQTMVYIIVGIITLIAIAAKAVWDGIVAVATWAWENGIKPIFDVIATVAAAVWNGITWLVTTVWNGVAAILSSVWEGIIKPVFDVIGTVASAVWNGIGAGLQWVWDNILKPVWDSISGNATAVWDGIKTGAQAVWDFLKSVWEPVSAFFSKIWDGIGKAGTAVWDGIKAAAKTVGDVVKGIWDGVMDVVKGVWNFIAKGWNSIPSYTVPDWIPLIGGKTFGLPKLPMLWQGGYAPGGAAIVGEHGAEPLVVGGRVVDMLGRNGPEIASIPRGGYVVPNLDTLAAFPSIMRGLPGGVAAAVSRSVPGYADMLGTPSRLDAVAPEFTVHTERGHDGALLSAVRELATAVREQVPPIVAGSGTTKAEVMAALRQHEREQAMQRRYSYGGN